MIDRNIGTIGFLFRSVALGILIVLSFPLLTMASGEIRYTNSDTGRSIYIDDGADLLTDEEETALVQNMKPITDYGEAGFLTVASHAGGYWSYATDYYYDHWENESGILLVIDMQYRELTLLTNGEILSVVTSGKCSSITDNIYRLASDGAYAACAEEAYMQANALLEGHRIAEPMRYITSGLLALLIALLINFLLVRRAARINAAAIDEIAATTGIMIKYQPAEVTLLREEKHYDPISNDSDSGGSGGSGGGFSGGGGSHGF